MFAIKAVHQSKIHSSWVTATHFTVVYRFAPLPLFRLKFRFDNRVRDNLQSSVRVRAINSNLGVLSSMGGFDAAFVPDTLIVNISIQQCSPPATNARLPRTTTLIYLSAIHRNGFCSTFGDWILSLASPGFCSATTSEMTLWWSTGGVAAKNAAAVLIKNNEPTQFVDEQKKIN